MSDEKPSVEETLYRLNGTFLKEGDAGKALIKIGDQLEIIADRLEKMNWNLGTIAKEAKAEK